MPDPSKPIPLEVEAVEAAAKVLKELGDERIGRRPAEVVELYLDEARAAILAADEARGMRVEQRERYNERARAYYPPEQRLVSEWRSVDAPYRHALVAR